MIIVRHLILLNSGASKELGMIRNWIALNVLSNKLEYKEAKSYCAKMSKGYYFTCMSQSIDKIPEIDLERAKFVVKDLVLTEDVKEEANGIYYIPSPALRPITYILEPSIISFSRYLTDAYHKFVSMSLMGAFDEVMINHKSVGAEYNTLISLDNKFGIDGFLQFHMVESGIYELNILASNANIRGLGKKLMNTMYDKIFEFPENTKRSSVTIKLKTLAGTRISGDLRNYYIHQGYNCDDMDDNGSYHCSKTIYKK